jgi:hypothetical protein
MKLLCSLAKVTTLANNKTAADNRIKFYSSNILYLFNYLNPTKQKEGLEADFYPDSSSMKEDSASDSKNIFPIREIFNGTQEFSVDKASHFSRILFRLLESVFLEKPEMDMIILNLLYPLRILEEILVSDSELFKEKKPKRISLEFGLSLEEYLQFSIFNKLYTLDIIEILMKKFKGYFVRHLDWLTNALNYLWANFKR